MIVIDINDFYKKHAGIDNMIFCHPGGFVEEYCKFPTRYMYEVIKNKGYCVVFFNGTKYKLIERKQKIKPRIIDKELTYSQYIAKAKDSIKSEFVCLQEKFGLRMMITTIIFGVQ